MNHNDRLPEKGQGDYEYLISLDNERALRKVRVAEKVIGRFVETTTDADVCRKNLGTVLVRTHDDRGRIAGLSDNLLHSKRMQYPFGPGYLDRVGINYDGRVKGTVPTCGPHGGEFYVDVSFVSDMTVSEMKENPGELRWQVEEEAARVFDEHVRPELEAYE